MVDNAIVVVDHPDDVVLTVILSPLAGCLKVGLKPDADYFGLAGVLSSELLDLGRIIDADASTG